MAKWDNPIGIPFAENGDRTNIPDTSESGDVNNTTGFGNKYEIDPAVGGLWLYRQTMNSLFYNMFSSIKEIQTKVPISVNGETPDASGNIPIVIPEADGAGIKIIDDNNPDITSFNQITEDGIYYIYKQLSDGPLQNGEPIRYNYINLIVVNVNITAQDFDMCMQMTSFGTYPYFPIPGNVGTTPMIRSYNKTIQQWDNWGPRHGIPFVGNNVIIDTFATDKLNTMFPIIATDNTSPNGYNKFMYSATKEQIREQLGITDGGDADKDTWTVYIPHTLGRGMRCHSAMYKIYNREINGASYRGISVIAVVSVDITINSANLYILTIGAPNDIKIYLSGTTLTNGGMSSMAYSLHGIDASNIGGEVVNATACYITSNSNIFYPSFTLFDKLDVGEEIQSAVLTFQIDALIDDRNIAPTPASVAVTKILDNSVTLTYTRG